MLSRVFLVIVAMLLLAACKKEQPSAPAAQGKAPGATAGAAGPGGQLPPGHPPMAGGPAAAAGAAAGGGLSGQVVETMNAGGYTYLKLRTAQGEKWAAVQQAAVKKGQMVTVARPMLMKKFQSKSLDRTFDEIFFGALAGGPGTAAGGTGGAAPASGTQEARQMLANAHKKAGGPAKVALDKPLPRAPGPEGRTVAQVHGQKAKLKDKTVAIRGKVVKVNSGIMGRNWIHIQDGTGSGKTGDLTVTSKQSAEVGDTVLVRGTLRTDKNFGSGYLYSVIVEDASIAKP